MTIFRPPVTTLFSAFRTTIDSPWRSRFAIWLAARPRMRSLASTTVAFGCGTAFFGGAARDPVATSFGFPPPGAGFAEAGADEDAGGLAGDFVIFGARGAFFSPTAAGAAGADSGSGKESDPRSVRFGLQKLRDRECLAAGRVDLDPRVLGVVERRHGERLRQRTVSEELPGDDERLLRVGEALQVPDVHRPRLATGSRELLRYRVPDWGLVGLGGLPESDEHVGELRVLLADGPKHTAR